MDGGGIIPDCRKDVFNCDAIIVVRLADLFGQRITGCATFLFVVGAFPAGGDPKRPIIPGLSGLIPKVRSISSNVGDCKY